MAKKTSTTGTKFVLQSTVHDDTFVHLTDDVNDKTPEYCIKKGLKDAKQFSQSELDKYLKTLPENNGLEVVEVE